MYNGNTGIFEKEFDCIADACRYINVSLDNVAHICECCSGKRYSCAKHLWSYDKKDRLEVITKGNHLIFKKLIGYNNEKTIEFSSMKDAYEYFDTPNKGKIKQCVLNPTRTFKGYYWRIEL